MKTIEQMAEEAGFEVYACPVGSFAEGEYRVVGDDDDCLNELTRFAALVRSEAMKEAICACSQVHENKPWDTSYWNQAVGQCVAQIGRSLNGKA